METAWWLIALVATSAITAGVVFVLMRSRAEVSLAKQREELAAVRAALAEKQQTLEESLRSAESSARSKAMEEFLADIRVEERNYIRENKILFLTRKSVVRQERIFFRNLPLSNWVEQEMPFEEGADVDALAKAMSVFVPEGLLDMPEERPRKLIRR